MSSASARDDSPDEYAPYRSRPSPPHLTEVLGATPAEWRASSSRVYHPLGYRGYLLDDDDSDDLDEEVTAQHRDCLPPEHDPLAFTDGQGNPRSPPAPGVTRFVVAFGSRHYWFLPPHTLGVVVEDCTDCIAVRLANAL